MNKLAIIAVLIPFSLGACSSQEIPAVELEVADPTAAPFPAATPFPDPTQALEEPEVETPLPVETAEPNCLGAEVNPMAQRIADDYPFSSYEQVMTWFCNGAAFEDILVALETESQAEFSAEEMLEWLSQGFTWEDIWQHLDIMD